MSMFNMPNGTDEIKIKKDINDFMRKTQEETKTAYGYCNRRK